MTVPAPQFDELADLVWALSNDRLDADGGLRLRRMLESDAANRRAYLELIDQFALLEWEKGEDETSELGILCSWFAVGEEVAPTFSPLPSPLSSPFVGGPVFSYMVASVVLCLMLLSAWAYKITCHQEIVAIPPNAKNEFIVVGRITGMKDCVWPEDALGTMVGASVPLGRKYVISSGLLEIIYCDGARVILEGPCEYKVDSTAGGFLVLGKLTARVEKRGERSGGLAVSATSAKPQAASSLSTLHSPLFTISTPTAIVTDLGTEFGVEVNENGDTTSHVFRGSVKVQATGATPMEVLLHADESARVARKSSSEETALYRLGKNATAPKFVRRMAPPPKTLDLLDIVAGGNGTGHRRERGIDPATGREDSFFIMKAYHGADDYQPIVWHSLIDGIFVPKRNATTARLDSAGHTFDGFDFGTGGTVGSIWARAAEVAPIKKKQDRWTWVYTMTPADRFMPNEGGLLCLHADAGITFDLAAMRKMFDGARPSRFRTTAGMATPGPNLPDPYGKADLWIFVDGRLMQTEKGVQIGDDAIGFDVELGPEDRFLTLVSTDAGNGCNFDWVVFGEPILEMTSTEQEQREEEKQP